MNAFPDPNVISSAVFALLFVIFFTVLPKAIVQVDSGKVGIIYRAGKLQSELLNPGYGIVIPYIDIVEQVSVSFVTERIENVPCGTNGGVNIYFDLIEVVHRLKRTSVIETVANYSTQYAKTWIVDRIHHEMNQFCSTATLQDVYIAKFDRLDENLMIQLRAVLETWAPGVELISIRVTKPTIPERLMAQYSEISNKQGQLLIRQQQRKTILKKVENEGTFQLKNAIKQFDVAKVNLKQNEDEAEKQVEIEAIADEMYIARGKQISDSLKYRLEKEAESNRIKLTREYLEYTKVQAFSNNLVVVHGDKIPTYIVSP